MCLQCQQLCAAVDGAQAMHATFSFFNAKAAIKADLMCHPTVQPSLHVGKSTQFRTTYILQNIEFAAVGPLHDALKSCLYKV